VKILLKETVSCDFIPFKRAKPYKSVPFKGIQSLARIHTDEDSDPGKPEPLSELL